MRVSSSLGVVVATVGLIAAVKVVLGVAQTALERDRSPWEPRGRHLGPSFESKTNSVRQ